MTAIKSRSYTKKQALVSNHCEIKDQGAETRTPQPTLTSSRKAVGISNCCLPVWDF